MTSMVREDNEFLNESNICSLVLNAGSETTMKMGMTNTSRTIYAMIGYLCALLFHQVKRLKSFVVNSHTSNKYLSTSDLHSKSFSSTMYWEEI
jgi:hypothetical protein